MFDQTARVIMNFMKIPACLTALSLERLVALKTAVVKQNLIPNPQVLLPIPITINSAIKTKVRIESILSRVICTPRAHVNLFQIFQKQN